MVIMLMRATSTPALKIMSLLTDRIAAEVAHLTEAKRKVHGKQHIQAKGVGLSPLQGGARLRSTRSSSLRRQHYDKQAAMKVNKKHDSYSRS